MLKRKKRVNRTTWNMLEWFARSPEIQLNPHIFLSFRDTKAYCWRYSSNENGLLDYLRCLWHVLSHLRFLGRTGMPLHHFWSQMEPLHYLIIAHLVTGLFRNPYVYIYTYSWIISYRHVMIDRYNRDHSTIFHIVTNRILRSSHVYPSIHLFSYEYGETELYIQLYYACYY